MDEVTSPDSVDPDGMDSSTHPRVDVSADRIRRWTHTVSIGILLCTCLCLLWPGLSGGGRLGFRDTAFFYDPLYRLVAAQDHAGFGGRRCAWNPYDSLSGTSLAGETTTAVFYPPRHLIYLTLAADGDDSRSAMALHVYLLLHLMLAGVAALYAARIAGASSCAAGLAAIVYPLSGPVWFQIYNVPFLVGAAWAPFAIGALTRLLNPREHRGEWRSIAIAALAMSACVLGGDPQMAFMVIVVFAALIVFRFCQFALGRVFRRVDDAGTESYQVPGQIQGQISSRRRLWLIVSRLATAAGLAGVIAAPQIAESIRSAALSDRTGAACDVWSVGAAAMRRPEALSHAEDVYRFSVAPWHWLQSISPAAGGQFFPENRRLSALIPGEDWMWVT
ncbi:MAG: hypothetical protein AAFP69_23435, partial [Planctomycetota bacterium]